jgi:hypothetical protein
MGITMLTIGLLAVSGAAIVAVGLFLLIKGKITLPQESSAEGGAFDVEIPNVVTVRTRYPALGLLIIGALSILGAVQLAREEQTAALALAREERAEEQAAALAQWFELTGQVKARHPSSVSDARISLLNRYIDLVPLDDGSIRGAVHTGMMRYEIRVRSAGHQKAEWNGAIKRDPSQGLLSLPAIDLDEVLGERVVARPEPVPGPSGNLPGRDQSSSWGRGG